MRRIPLLDVGLAAAGLVCTLAEWAQWWRWGATAYLVQALVATGLTAALAVRRRHLTGSAVATAVLLGVLALNFWAAPVGMGVSPLLLCAPLTVVAVTRYGRRRGWGVVAVLVALAGIPVSPALQLFRAGQGLQPFERLGELAPMIAVHVLVIAVAYLWALRQREVTDRHTAELAEVRARALAHAELVAAHDRNRIAADVHDIVAHTVALIRVEAATGLCIAEDEPEHAVRALATIKDAAGEAMAELRTLVGLLRSPADADLVPGGTRTTVPALLDRIRDTGLLLDADVPDDEGLAHIDALLGPATSLVAVRVLQEGLTNAVKHGDRARPVTAALYADGGGGGVRVEVRNRPGTAAGGSGHGLAGMRQRVAAVGGRVTVHADDHEHVLAVWLPPAGTPHAAPAGPDAPVASGTR